MQVLNYSSTHVFKYVIMQVFKSERMQVFRYVSLWEIMQLYKCEDVQECKNKRRQEYKYAGMKE